MAFRPTPRRLALAAGLAVLLALPVLLSARPSDGGSSGAPSPSTPATEEEFLRRFAEILAVAGENYVVEVPPEKLVAASIRGMLANLDPHTNFLEADEYGAMREKQQGSFFGLGIIVSKRDGKVTVISPIEGTPAHRLGIRPGDVIAEVDGRPVGNQPIDEVIRQLKGPKGTQVTVTLQRPGFEEPIRLTITRAEIPTNSVRYAFMASPGVGFLKITDFTHTTSREVREALDRLEREGMKNLVLDLRGNPGGILDQSVEVADLFLRKGEMVVYTEGRIASSYQKFVAPGKTARADLPIVVLIDNGSASASEIVTGALQDHDRAVVVGTRSWGKGLVQSVYNLSGGSGLALTTARYYTPSGRCIQRDYSSWIDYVLPENGDGDGEETAEIPEVSDGKEYFTESGRKVSGGGGIAPDVTVRQKKASKLFVRLQSRGAFFNFAVDWANRNPSVPRTFEVTDPVFDEFARFLTQGKGSLFATVEEAKGALAKDDDPAMIRRAIKAEILSAKYGMESGFRVGLEGDPQFRSALEQLGAAQKLVMVRSAAVPPAKPRG